MVVDVPHTTLGTVKTLGLPIKLSETPGGPTRGAPLYGEHTREVLREEGYDEAAIARLIDAAAVVAVGEQAT
jgi:crotonobetainyl-CoA:carnitine CoA-transferase CaiB-like acyl-CoA transferase